MSDKEEHELRCGESFPRSAPKPQRSTATSARCSFPLAIRVQHGTSRRGFGLRLRSVVTSAP